MSKIKIVYTLLFFFLGAGVALQAQEEVSAASLYNQALESLKAKDYDGAYPLLQQALEKADPENETDAKVIDLTKKNGARATYALGTAARKDNDLDKALEYFDQGIEWSPGYYANYLGRAQVLEAKELDTDALRAYLKAAEKAVEDGKEDQVESLYTKASNFVAKAYAAKKYDEAIALADEHNAMRDDVHSVYYYLGASLLEKGDPAKALPELDKAIEKAGADDEELGKYYYKKGQCHEQLGQKSEAIAAYGSVKDPKYVEAAKYQIGQLNN